LEQCAFRFRFPGRNEEGESKELEELLREKIRKRGSGSTGTAIPLERWLMSSIKDKKRLYREGEEAEESVIEGT
jgi:hypothetical protein